ncbi:MAG: glutathione S-transferase N-terminal domain-containing protein [Methylococcales bacterium]
MAGVKVSMVLFSLPLCIQSHRVRLTLYEKGISADVKIFDANDPPEDMQELNPYGEMPALIDRDLVIYDSRIIMEYLDERFPHPPLQATDPVTRARGRMMIHRIESDWYAMLNEIEETKDKKKAIKPKKLLKESLVSALPLFEAEPFFMNQEVSLIDCSLAPLLWRLPSLGVEIPKEAAAIRSYAERMFKRSAFQASLSAQELELAPAVNFPHR